MPDATKQKLFLYVLGFFSIVLFSLWLFFGGGGQRGVWLVDTKVKVRGRRWIMGDPTGHCACPLSHPKDIPKPSHPPWGSFHESWTQPAQGTGVQSQTLGTACPSALTLQELRKKKNPRPVCARSTAWEHIFSFPG